MDVGRFVDKIHEGIRDCDKFRACAGTDYNKGYDDGRKAAYENVLRWLGECLP